MRQTVPQEFAEFQGSCADRGTGRYCSIDRSNEQTNERTCRELSNYVARGSARLGEKIITVEICSFVHFIIKQRVFEYFVF